MKSLKASAIDILIRDWRNFLLVPILAILIDVFLLHQEIKYTLCTVAITYLLYVAMVVGIHHYLQTRPLKPVKK